MTFQEMQEIKDAVIEVNKELLRDIKSYNSWYIEYNNFVNYSHDRITDIVVVYLKNTDTDEHYMLYHSVLTDGDFSKELLINETIEVLTLQVEEIQGIIKKLSNNTTKNMK